MIATFLIDSLKALVTPFLLSYQKQPRVFISCKQTAPPQPGAISASANCPSGLEIELYNQSAFKALDIKASSPTAGLKLPELDRTRGHLRAMERKRFAITIPEGTEIFEVILEYRNEYRKYFYTHYLKRGCVERNMFKWRRPKPRIYREDT
jgi:hypothetical protein